MTNNYSTIDVETENNRVKNVNPHSIHLGFILQYITHYLLLYCKEHIQMTNNYSTIDVETENNRVKNASEIFNTLRINTTFC